jgi:hypothetical protein
MVQQPVQHVGRFVAGRRHDAHAVRPVLVGDMGVEAQPGIVAVAGVDFSGGVARLAERKTCRSEDDVVPSPQVDAIGIAWWAPIILASAAL